MIGAFVTGRVVSREPGILPSIYVHGIDNVLELIAANGDEIVKPRILRETLAWLRSGIQLATYWGFGSEDHAEPRLDDFEFG